MARQKRQLLRVVSYLSKTKKGAKVSKHLNTFNDILSQLESIGVKIRIKFQEKIWFPLRIPLVSCIHLIIYSWSILKGTRGKVTFPSNKDICGD
jgi:hypothetical protein